MSKFSEDLIKNRIEDQPAKDNKHPHTNLVEEDGFPVYKPLKK